MRNHQPRRDDAPSVSEGFTFHMLRHTAASQVARADMDPAADAERREHGDRGAVLHKAYRHLYEGEIREGEKPIQAQPLDALV